MGRIKMASFYFSHARQTFQEVLFPPLKAEAGIVQVSNINKIYRKHNKTGIWRLSIIPLKAVNRAQLALSNILLHVLVINIKKLIQIQLNVSACGGLIVNKSLLFIVDRNV